MIRTQKPFHGRRYAGDINEKIVHDTLFEKSECEIGKLKIKNIKVFSPDNFKRAIEEGFKPCKYCRRFDQKV